MKKLKTLVAKLDSTVKFMAAGEDNLSGRVESILFHSHTEEDLSPVVVDNTTRELQVARLNLSLHIDKLKEEENTIKQLIERLNLLP